MYNYCGGLKMIRRIMTNSVVISYEITRKKVKRLNLKVGNDGSVHVSIPYHVDFEQADRFVARSLPFIEKARKQLSDIAEKAERDKGYAYFLGERLKINAVRGEKFSAQVKDGEVFLTVKSEEEIPAAKDKWLRAESERLFPEICMEKYLLFREQGFDVPFPKITCRKMKTRWGSCTMEKKRITLNIMLMEKPVECIGYVIAHELAHFVVQDHSKRFYGVLERVVPDWREMKKKLK